MMSRLQGALSSPTAKKYIGDVALLVISQVFFYYGVKYIMNQLNPVNAKRRDAQERSKRNLSRLGMKDLKLNAYEEIIASELVFPEDIAVSFQSIGGLDNIVQELRESVIYPLTYPHIFNDDSKMLGVPKGVLLYGPPGCGKTMIAKALAKESNATFINLHISTMTDKWFGESNKLVSALFSLARKLAPTIIFVDEIDAFLRERRATDHEAMAMVKAEFMSLWDGLSSGDQRIIILGATNRPNDIDPAILRRMPKRFPVGAPNAQQRASILRILLSKVNVEEGFDLDRLVSMTHGLSGSDLNELTRNAAMIPVRELVRRAADMSLVSNADARPVTMADFVASHPALHVKVQDVDGVDGDDDDDELEVEPQD